mgnify:CR=1 FL=1
MYGLGEAEALLKGVDIKIDFKKSISPLSVFKGLDAGCFDYVECKRCVKFWEIPQRLVWLNLWVPATQGRGCELSFSVSLLEDNVYVLYVGLYNKYSSKETYQYYETGAIENVFKLIISTLQQYGDLDEIDKYVEVELKGY